MFFVYINIKIRSFFVKKNKIKSRIVCARLHKDANASNWMENLIQCDCPFFQKNFFCKHSMGLAVLQNLATVPSNAKYDVSIGKLKKKGRPPKAKKALVVMNDKTNSLV
jgi:hypothetical protein